MTPDRQTELAARLEAEALKWDARQREAIQMHEWSKRQQNDSLENMWRHNAADAAIHAADLRAAAQAVRASQWRPIAEAKQLGVGWCIVGKWVNGKLWSQKETAYLDIAIEDGYTYYFVVPVPPEAVG